MLKIIVLAIIRHVRGGSELTIKDMLSNSIVKAVMEADGINPYALEVELNGMARLISARRVCPKFLCSVGRRRGSDATLLQGEA